MPQNPKTFVVPERCVALYTTTLKDENGAVVPGASLSQVLFWLIDGQTGAVINSRNGSNLLGTEIAVSSQGVLTFTLLPADNAIGNDGLDVETHVMIFWAKWNAGAKGVPWRIEVDVQNIEKVT